MKVNFSSEKCPKIVYFIVFPRAKLPFPCSFTTQHIPISPKGSENSRNFHPMPLIHCPPRARIHSVPPRRLNRRRILSVRRWRGEGGELQLLQNVRQSAPAVTEIGWQICCSAGADPIGRRQFVGISPRGLAPIFPPPTHFSSFSCFGSAAMTDDHPTTSTNSSSNVVYLPPQAHKMCLHILRICYVMSE